MKYIEALGGFMTPVMQGKQVPVIADGLVQEAQRVLGVTSDLMFSDVDVNTEVALLVSEYYGLPAVFSWDVYNFEAEALGQKVQAKGYNVPELDTRVPLVKSEGDLDKLRWPTDNPLDAGRYPLFISQIETASRYYPYHLSVWIPTVSSFSLACNLCGGSTFLATAYEEPEFAHAVLRKITDEIHTPLIKAIAERFPGIAISMSDAWECVPNVSFEMQQEFGFDYFDRLLENTKGIDGVIQWFVAYSEGYADDPYAYIMKKTKYAHAVNNTVMADIDLDIYRRVAIDAGVPMTVYVPTTAIQSGTPESIIEYMRGLAKALRPGVGNFVWMTMCGANAPRENVWASIAAAKAFGAVPAQSPEEFDAIEVTVEMPDETFCDFVRRKAVENPDGYTFKWMDESKFAE